MKATVKTLLERRAQFREMEKREEKRLSQISHTKTSSRKMKSWIKLLGEDHDGESTFLLKILLLKLEFMRRYFEKSKIGFDGPKNSKEILEVIVLLKNISEEEHPDTTKAIELLEKRFGARKLRTIEGPSRKLGKSKLTQVVFVSEWDKLPKKRRDLAKSLMRKIILEEEVLRKRDTMAAFSLIAENLWNWWV